MVLRHSDLNLLLFYGLEYTVLVMSKWIVAGMEDTSA